MDEASHAAAYGGPEWSPRTAALRDEIGSVWGSYRVGSEVDALRAVLLHGPGEELVEVEPESGLMLASPELEVARVQHEAMAEFYRGAGVEVIFVEPTVLPPPNQMFVADLFFMTPEGAIIARPASTVRAGEERWVARRLAELGVPILRTVGGTGTFEGADAMWLDGSTVMLGRGLRTNAEGGAQVAATLREIGVDTVHVDLPFGAMHLMGQVRLLDVDLAAVWHRRVSYVAVETLRRYGFQVVFFPDPLEAECLANNFVTLEPRRILMSDDAPRSRAFYEGVGVRCETVRISELTKAAGGIGCLTGVLRRGG